MTPIESLLTAREASQVLHINRYLIYRLVRDGDLPAIRVGRMVRFRPEDLREWIEKHRMIPGGVETNQVPLFP